MRETGERGIVGDDDAKSGGADMGGKTSLLASAMAGSTSLASTPRAELLYPSSEPC
jgi:hypothetical protein